ncbi:MAG: TolC family protein [Acidobacteria bacterium]|nr:TolC family protein [Acidobacteriota bacterium]
MKTRIHRFLLLFSGLILAVVPASPAQTPQDPQGFLRDYSQGPSFFRSYQEQPIPPMVLENSTRLRDLIRDGRLELSLADTLALAIENNLDIAVQRYLRPMAHADVLRAKSGQAARGVQGASVPGGLSAGAIGAGISEASGGGGTGSAGGITGGGGAVNVPQVGAFDPAVSFNFSWDRATSPLNSQVVAGVPTVTTYATAYSGSYTQLFPTGTSYFLALTGLRQSSTQQNLLFNPAVISRFALGFNQPVLNGFGRLPNERFLLVAQNNLRISEEVFRQQVVTVIVQVTNAYWDLAAFQESVKVAEQSLDVAQQLYEDNKKQAEIGTLAPLDVVASESEVAGRQRDLVVAQTNLQLQETRLKNFLSKKLDPALDAAQLALTDRLPEPRDADTPNLASALATAFNNRPDLRQTEGNLQNQSLSVRFTQNGLLPSGSVFGLYAGSGLQGISCSPLPQNAPANTPAPLPPSCANNVISTQPTAGGAAESFRNTFAGDFPEYAGGLSLNLPLRNRAAQADNLRAQLEGDQLEVGLQRARNQVALEVRQAATGLVQGKAQVEAAHQAVRLAQETLNAEQKKLEAGISAPYQAVLRQRDLQAAQRAEVQAVVNYAKALVEMDRATGTTLNRNGIELLDAWSGTVSRLPNPPFNIRGFETGAEGSR